MMIKLLNFIRDWLPSLAVLVAGVWVVFRWGYEEKRRASREIPSLDSTGQCTAIPLDRDRIVLSLLTTWRNKGSIPIKLDPNRTRVDVFQIGSDLPTGILEQTSLTVPAFSRLPLQYSNNPFLEPNTESTLTTHFILNREGIYLFRTQLYISSRREDLQIAWTHEQVFSPSHTDLNRDCK